MHIVDETLPLRMTGNVSLLYLGPLPSPLGNLDLLIFFVALVAIMVFAAAPRILIGLLR